MRLKAIADHNRVVRLEDWNGLDLTGGNDMQSIIALGQAQAASDNRILVVPVGSMLCGTTVPITASMRGSGGGGYSSSFARTSFVPGMTDGSPCLKAVNKHGLDLRDFTVDANKDVSLTQNCIGIQLGQGCSLISSTTPPTQANPCVITTKYYHTFQTGDSVTVANVLGMTALNGGPYTVTRINASSFSVNVDSSAFGAYTSGGFVRPTDLGAANNVGRGVLENVFVNGMKVGFHLQGWLNKQLGLRANNCTLGLSGSYLNTNLLDLVTERCGQAVELLGCNKLHILRLEDEGPTSGALAVPSTIDYSDTVICDVWSTEGARSTNTEWLTIGGVSSCEEIHIKDGILSAAPGGAKSVVLNMVTGFTLPPTMDSGFSTTSSSIPGRTFTPVWTASGTAPDIGNGSISGNYVWHGDSVTVNVRLTAGSTTTYGTGNYSFSLPFTAKYQAMGAAKMLDSGTAHFVGTVLVDAAASTAQVYAPAQVGQTYPHTWATSDTLAFTITYSVSGTP